jgi:hypothetical protein
MYRSPLDSWTNEGTFVLIGDSYHPMLPYLARGANSSIEDGGVLLERLKSKTSFDTGSNSMSSSEKPGPRQSSERHSTKETHFTCQMVWNKKNEIGISRLCLGKRLPASFLADGLVQKFNRGSTATTCTRKLMRLWQLELHNLTPEKPCFVSPVAILRYSHGPRRSFKRHASMHSQTLGNHVQRCGDLSSGTSGTKGYQ